MAKLKSGNHASPEISQASTADIAFLLLIFFISTTVFETEFGIPLVLPGLGGEATKVKRDNVLTIRTDDAGQIYMNDNIVGLRELRTLVTAEIAANKNIVISIETDGDAAYERMIDVLDEVKAAEAPSISIKKSRG